MKSMIKLTALGALLFTTACSSGPFGPANASAGGGWDSAAARQIDDRIAESAKRSAEATETLAQVERAKTAPAEPAVDGDELAKLPPELQRPTTVEWTGPAADLVNELARNIGYTYAIVGEAPVVDVMVSVSAVDEPAIKVFEDIGYQVSKLAEIFVDPNGKRIEFRFLTDAHAAEKAPAPAKSAAPRLSAPKMASADTAAEKPRSVRRAKDRLGK